MSAVDPPANGGLLKYRVQVLEDRFSRQEDAIRRVDDRLDEKDKRDQRIEDKMDTLIAAYERSEESRGKFTNWLQIVAGTIFAGTIVAIVTLALNS